MNGEHLWRVPLLYAYGRVGSDTPLLAGSTYLIMNRLGSSLSTIVDRVYGGVVPVSIVMNIGLQVNALYTDSLERADTIRVTICALTRLCAQRCQEKQLCVGAAVATSIVHL
jgi:hypothetical protein